MQRKSIQKILISFCFALISFYCTFPLRNSHVLESDNHLILLGNSSNPENPADAIKKLKNATSIIDKNNLAVYHIRNSELNIAEKILKEIILSGNDNRTPLLNLFRLYYITDEYNEIRKFFLDYSEKMKFNKVVINGIINELESQKRTEEKIILLDTLTNVPGFEMKAMEELGIYFTNIQNYQEAENYFEKILQADAFNPVALYNLALISLESGNWKDVIMYAGNLQELKTVSGDIYFLLLKANYELGNFKEAIQLAEKAPLKEKESLEFLSIWRNCILASDLHGSLLPVQKIFRGLKSKGLKMEEHEFFPGESKEGQEIINNIIQGM